MQLDDAATILSRADFFEICDAEQRRLLAFASERRRHRPGSVIYSGSDNPLGAHILISGTVSSTYDGHDDPYLIHQPGVVIGAMALVLARPRAVTVKAVDAVETLWVPRTAFMKLAQQYPDMAKRAAMRIRREMSGYVKALEGVRPRISGE